METRVLVVDDDRFARQVLADTLSEAGFEVQQAANGEEGCRIAREWLPDAILLDLVMPGMNGLEACQRLRSQPEFHHATIIMMTSRTELRETADPFLVGADDFLAKPFNRDDLIARIRGNLFRKRTLEDLSRKASDYEQLFEFAAEGLVAFNEVGELVFANRKAEQILGFSRSELQEMGFAPLLSPSCRRRALRRLRKAERTGEAPERFDVTARTKSGDARILSVSLNRGLAGEGFLVAAFRDVTEKRRMEQELRETRGFLQEANERLRQMDRMRREFLDTAVHELRTPVTIVHGYCSLVKQLGTEGWPKLQEEYLDAAIQGSDRLMDLINNLLDLSRFEAGRMEPEIETLDLCETLQEVFSRFETIAARNGQELRLESPAKALARFDRDQIQRVLVNLVDNALKFTPPGGRIRMVLEDEGGEVVVTVEDNGRGIPVERLPDLFRQFTKVGSKAGRRGFGLGLSICKKIIDSHQGRLWAESRPGEGSRFRFTLPRSF